MAYNPEDPNSINPANYEFSGPAFYFDKEIALRMGHYKDDPEISIGMRWMVAEGDQGYPVSRGRPMWMVMPHKLAEYMLQGIQNNWDREQQNIQDSAEFNAALALIQEQAS